MSDEINFEQVCNNKEYIIPKAEAIAGLKIGMKYFAERELFQVAEKIKGMIALIENDITDPAEGLHDFLKQMLKDGILNPKK